MLPICTYPRRQGRPAGRQREGTERSSRSRYRMGHSEARAAPAGRLAPSGAHIPAWCRRRIQCISHIGAEDYGPYVCLEYVKKLDVVWTEPDHEIASHRSFFRCELAIKQNLRLVIGQHARVIAVLQLFCQIIETDVDHSCHCAAETLAHAYFYTVPCMLLALTSVPHLDRIRYDRMYIPEVQRGIFLDGNHHCQ